MLHSPRVQESEPQEIPEMVRIGIEASRVATEKMLDFYRRMDIRVTPQMTLAPDEPEAQDVAAGDRVAVG